MTNRFYTFKGKEKEAVLSSLRLTIKRMEAESLERSFLETIIVTIEADRGIHVWDIEEMRRITQEAPTVLKGTRHG